MAPEVRAFLRDHIESHEELEILLLICRRLDRAWTGSAVAAELGISPALAKEALESLCRESLLHGHARGSTILFGTTEQTAETRDMISKLTAAYDQYRFEIVALLATNAIERLRTRALRTFSDSFVIRRKKG